MSLFDELESHQRSTPFASSSEAAFYNENAYLLSGVEQWAMFLKPLDSFLTIRANILIRGLLNKARIEKLYATKMKEAPSPKEERLSLRDYMASEMATLPYLLDGNEKIYVPFFPRSLNALYAKEWKKLALSPYERLLRDYQAAIVDAFDYYGYALYDSYFTKVVPIRKSPNLLAAYDYDAEALYFINDEGRLDAKICLFDRDIKSPVKTHMVKRIEAVADAYFANDRNALIQSLVQGNLISSSLMHQILGKEIKFSEKKEKGEIVK
jgi:hypothetical protein